MAVSIQVNFNSVVVVWHLKWLFSLETLSHDHKQLFILDSVKSLHVEVVVWPRHWELLFELMKHMLSSRIRPDWRENLDFSLPQSVSLNP